MSWSESSDRGVHTDSGLLPPNSAMTWRDLVPRSCSSSASRRVNERLAELNMNCVICLSLRTRALLVIGRRQPETHARCIVCDMSTTSRLHAKHRPIQIMLFVLIPLSRTRVRKYGMTFRSSEIDGRFFSFSHHLRHSYGMIRFSHILSIRFVMSSSILLRSVEDNDDGTTRSFVSSM
jgi:hypothetical protein